MTVGLVDALFARRLNGVSDSVTVYQDVFGLHRLGDVFNVQTKPVLCRILKSLVPVTNAPTHLAILKKLKDAGKLRQDFPNRPHYGEDLSVPTLQWMIIIHLDLGAEHQRGVFHKRTSANLPIWVELDVIQEEPADCPDVVAAAAASNEEPARRPKIGANKKAEDLAATVARDDSPTETKKAKRVAAMTRKRAPVRAATVAPSAAPSAAPSSLPPRSPFGSNAAGPMARRRSKRKMADRA